MSQGVNCFCGKWIYNFNLEMTSDKVIVNFSTVLSYHNNILSDKPKICVLHTCTGILIDYLRFYVPLKNF
jgi:hypothetical protein